jgi:hypothetical protein
VDKVFKKQTLTYVRNVKEISNDRIDKTIYKTGRTCPNTTQSCNRRGQRLIGGQEKQQGNFFGRSRHEVAYYVKSRRKKAEGK